MINNLYTIVNKLNIQGLPVSERVNYGFVIASTITDRF